MTYDKSTETKVAVTVNTGKVSKIGITLHSTNFHTLSTTFLIATLTTKQHKGVYTRTCFHGLVVMFLKVNSYKRTICISNLRGVIVIFLLNLYYRNCQKIYEIKAS